MREMQGNAQEVSFSRTKEKCTEDSGGGQKNETDALPDMSDHMGNYFSESFYNSIIDFWCESMIYTWKTKHFFQVRYF